MGLVFALQPDLRHSKAPEELVLRSHKKRFGLGGTLIFTGALLATMYTAASPLFKMLWEEGTLFDQMLASFFYGVIIVFPLVALFCWFFEEVVRLQKNPQDGTYRVSSYKKLLGFKWAQKELSHVNRDQLTIENWTGAKKNMAALRADAKGKKDRYGTYGHWMLNVNKDNESLTLERRARKEEIELLQTQIDFFFSPENLSS